jgi:hypothetical protein
VPSNAGGIEGTKWQTEIILMVRCRARYQQNARVYTSEFDVTKLCK